MVPALKSEPLRGEEGQPRFSGFAVLFSIIFALLGTGLAVDAQQAVPTPRIQIS
jgi:hypothetical protein